MDRAQYGVRWHYRDPPLVWLLVGAYLAHLLEEWFGGFPEWFALVAGAPLARDAFIIINAVGLAGMIGATRAAIRRESSGWMAIAIGALLLANGLLHLLGSLLTGKYSPGVLTGVILYIPLAQLVLLRAWLQTPRRVFALGVVAGVGVHALVSLIALIVARA